ncbi:hypothetical protein ACQP1G_17340 [Nocardia sp. CA-107356]|uniref:hypothetical protein n=1 Tax=Nocardia sp. CA-107356 TaxID=3239972 RepID=UPI003D9455E5
MNGPDDEARHNQPLDPALGAESVPESEHATEPGPDVAFMADSLEGDVPDVGFTLMGGAPQPEVDIAGQAKEITHRIARGLAAGGPQGWSRLDAVFALTTAAEVAVISFSDDQQRSVRVQPAEDVLALVREHRQLSAQLGDGPWWRFVLSLNVTGELEVDYDYGDEPFPEDQLFPPQIYAADLETYPRNSLPVWMAAYLGHAGRQSRTPQAAAAQASADRAEDVQSVVCENDFPAFPVMWSRWAVIAAAFVAAQSQWGPRVLPALGWFEGATRSGSTLYSLPGGRAVLSGGVWNAPELDVAYNGDGALPQLYAGAPEWVANPVLNPRGASGLLSFCYWYEGGRWHRGESVAADRLGAAVPGIWTADTVADVVIRLVAEEPTDRQRAAVATLIAAAEVGVVTRDTLVDVFGDDEGFDVDGAFYQLTLAGAAMTLPGPMSQQYAIAQVRQFILDRGLDTSGYPLDELRADRLSVGWMVFVPTRPGEISIGRAIFYIADDGVLEQSSSSVAPSVYIAEFEQRFQQRHGAVGA